MKKIIALLLVFLLSFPTAFVLAADTTSNITFSDVDATTTEGKAIYKLVKKGVLVGHGDGTFKPDDFLTRAELCKMVNLVFGYTESTADNFPDVSVADWFYPYVAVAKKAGYIAGHADGTFKGNDNLTREETCVVITRVTNLYDLPFFQSINDEVSDWAVPYVTKVLANRLMNLETGGIFRATENITRAELAVVLANFVIEETTTPSISTGTGSGSTGGGSTGSGSTGGGSTGGGSTGGGSTGGGSTGGGSTGSGSTGGGSTGGGSTGGGSTGSGSTGGGSTGGGSTGSGNTGSGNATPPVDDFDEAKQNTVVATVESLLSDIDYTLDNEGYMPVSIEEKNIIDTIITALKGLLADAENGEKVYETNYVSENYSTEAEGAKSIFDSLSQSEQDRIGNALVSWCDTADLDFLLYNFFGKRISDYIN